MLQNALKWLRESCMCVFGGKLESDFFREKLMPRDEGQLVREAVAAAVVSDANRLLLPVLQRALVHAWVSF